MMHEVRIRSRSLLGFTNWSCWGSFGFMSKRYTCVVEDTSTESQIQVVGLMVVLARGAVLHVHNKAPACLADMLSIADSPGGSEVCGNNHRGVDMLALAGHSPSRDTASAQRPASRAHHRCQASYQAEEAQAHRRRMAGQREYKLVGLGASAPRTRFRPWIRSASL
jgi:hypothetical protein